MRSLLVIVSQTERESWAKQLIQASGCAQPIMLVATPLDAAKYLADNRISPSHVVLDIGMRGADILAEIDELAQQCEPGTRVVAVGDTNDILLFREIIGRGVLDYVPMPAPIDMVLKSLSAPSAEPAATKPAKTNQRVIVFMSAASGDGASTVALNTAYAISQLRHGSTVLVDMDYQFGMVAKQLALQSQYGIRDLFEHPERGVDATLIKRMVAGYDKLHVITAPTDLRYLPSVKAEAIRDLITILKDNYDNVIIDLPHVWLPWVASAAQQSTHIVLVAQLWLKSVSHAARLMRAFRELGIGTDRVTPIINRSGAKFKEAIDPKDFERVCSAPIRFTISNDIKTVVTAESSAKTIMELQPSPISEDILTLARSILGLIPRESAAPKRATGLLSMLKG